jgi:hypothetical protein
MTVLTDTGLACRTAGHVDSGGTTWRLRSLVAMGHDATRIASALGVHPQTIQKILRGEAATVTARLRDEARHLWDAWWDKRPPELTCSQRRAAAASRLRAERLGWCPPLGLDEDALDEPGYRPYSRYRPAAGTGTAGESLPRADAQTVRVALVLQGQVAP